MRLPLKKISEHIERLSLDAVILDPGNIPQLGQTVTLLESIESLSANAKTGPLDSLTQAMKTYIEDVIMGETTDMEPFEKGVTRLQEICRNLINGDKNNNDISMALEALGSTAAVIDSGSEVSQTVDEELTDTVGSKPTAGDKGKSEIETEGNGAPAPLGDEDKEIIQDFAAESMENLGTIEIKLMDLEQEPDDMDIINAIFRPFHTVKGVSGFLNFNRINKLAHVAENLLDKARNKELCIDCEIVDIVLDSVDLLKRMIENVLASLETGAPHEGDVDTSQLISQIESYISQAEAGGKKPLGEMLVEKGSVSEEDVQGALETQTEEQGKKLGAILVEQKKTQSREVVCVLREQRKFEKPTALQVKVDTLKLDNMVDMVGELAIAQSMLRQHDMVQSSDDRKLYQITNQLNLLTSGLQNTAMSLRMVPIKNTFQKMLRLVRDLAKKAHKDIGLVMSGEDTEIDRNMVEEIYEPMVHMIRNSIDHGIELPDEREAHNKPRKGTINLKAYHKGGNIVIEIEDDGRGLNRDKILEKAISSGLVADEGSLTDQEIDNLIFHPGFSTADEITDISGRGVGTDVVKSKIDKLRGRVDVHSQSGEGTTFFIRLPLTLAIVDGMIIKVGQERYIIPTLSVQESFRPKARNYYTVKGENEMIQVRDNLVPLIRLDRIFNLSENDVEHEREKTPWDRLVVVVENQERKMCLLVDELVGQEEVVIKNLGGWLKDVKGIAGSVIMGDGTVGLILDVAGIFSMVSKDS
jgi:two-component system, chemotaxis family, sensor kinase CheA